MTIIFHPNYHLDAIQPRINNVASDGLHEAVFTVKVLDHRGIAIPDVGVDWSVDSNEVEVSAGKTDPQGDSWAFLRSRTARTFNVTASWHNEVGLFSEKTSSVTFKQSAPLCFTNKMESMTFGQGNAGVQSLSGGNKGEIAYSSSLPEVADFDQSKPEELILKKVGVTMITATEAGSKHFSEQSASYILNVEKATGAPPTFDNPAGEIEVAFDQGTLKNPATQKNGGSITYTSDRTDVATVDDKSGDVTLKAVGTARITATEIADNYEPASASYLLEVTPADGAVISFQGAKDITKMENDAPFQVTATGGSGGTIRYESDRDQVAKVNGSGFVTLFSPGIAKIIARERLNNNYKEKTAELELTVNPYPLTIEFKNPTTIGTVDFKVEGKKNQDVNLYLYNSKQPFKTKATDKNGVAHFELEIKAPNQKVAIRCTQGGKEITETLMVENYIKSVRPFFMQKPAGLAAALEVKAKFRANPKNESTCYPGWKTFSDCCFTTVDYSGGAYKDLHITDLYAEEFSKMPIDMRHASRVSFRSKHTGIGGLQLVLAVSMKQVRTSQDDAFFSPAHSEQHRIIGPDAGAAVLELNLSEFREVEKNIQGNVWGPEDLSYWVVDGFNTKEGLFEGRSYTIQNASDLDADFDVKFPFIDWKP